MHLRLITIPFSIHLLWVLALLSFVNSHVIPPAPSTIVTIHVPSGAPATDRTLRCSCPCDGLESTETFFQCQRSPTASSLLPSDDRTDLCQCIRQRCSCEDITAETTVDLHRRGCVAATFARLKQTVKNNPVVQTIKDTKIVDTYKAVRDKLSNAFKRGCSAGTQCALKPTDDV